MKTLNRIIALACVAALSLTSCVDDEPPYRGGEGGEQPGEAIGYLSSDLALQVIYDADTDTQNTQAGDTQSAAVTRTTPLKFFYLKITNEKSEVAFEGTYEDFQEKLAAGPLPLAVGNYRLSVESQKLEYVQAVTWDDPYYTADYNFAIEKSKTTTLGQVVCRLRNIKVTVMLSADLAAQFKSSSHATVTYGSAVADFALGETRAAYFLPQKGVDEMNFQFYGEFPEGGNVQASKTLKNVKTGEWRKISLVLSYATDGKMFISVVAKNFVMDSEVVIDGTNGLWEEEYEEPTYSEDAPTISWAGHDLTQPVTLTSDSFDGDGKPKERYSFDLDSPNGIEYFEVSVESTNTEFVESMMSVLGLTSSTFDLCALKGTQATILAGFFGTPVGDELKGKQNASFDITNVVPLLYDYKGTHTFTMTLIDKNGLLSSAALQFVAQAGGTGNGPTIQGRDFDVDKPYQLAAVPGAVVLDITAPNGGIQKLEVLIDSASLREMLADTPKLCDWFDLCTIDGEEAAFLHDSVGFPVGDEVRDQTSVTFTVASLFTGILAGMNQEVPGKPNAYPFRIKVTDNAGNTVSKTLTIVQPQQ